MININKMTDEALQFVSKDCYEAIQAYPQGHKAMEYLVTAQACDNELNRRGRIRSIRKDHDGYDTVIDPLTVPIRQRQIVRDRNARPYIIDRTRSNLFLLGWELKCKREGLDN